MAILCGSSSARAETADLMLSPTRIILEKDTHYATINIKNPGDATGRYHIEVVDTSMQENGGVKLLDAGAHDQFSALDYIRISPRVMTLGPGDYQTVRLLVKNPGSLADGEYRSALKVTMTESNLDAATNQPKVTELPITIKPKIVMAIPIIIRHGETTYHVDITDAHFVPSEGNTTNSRVHVSFGFDGTRSVIGDIKILHVDSDGKESILKFFPGIAIYRGVPKIDIDVPLEVPDGVDIRHGKNTVYYMAQESEGGGVLAQKDIP